MDNALSRSGRGAQSGSGESAGKEPGFWQAARLLLLGDDRFSRIFWCDQGDIKLRLCDSDNMTGRRMPNGIATIDQQRLKDLADLTNAVRLTHQARMKVIIRVAISNNKRR